MSAPPPRAPEPAAGPAPAPGTPGASTSRALHDGPAARVVLHTRPGCHLCDVARDVVVGACASTGDRWSEVDVDSAASRQDGLHERWTDLVPVVTVDGRHHAHFRVDPHDLVLALERGAPAAP